MEIILDTIGRIFAEYQFIDEYVPVFIFLIIAILFGVGSLVGAALVRPHKPDPEKLSPYECGIPPLMGARERFSIRFYIIGLLFVLFDIEVVFLFPWAVVYKLIGLYGLIEMALFILILLIGLFYAYKKGALTWV